jgi:hypothetical protein
MRKCCFLFLVLIFWPSQSTAIPTFIQGCQNGTASGSGLITCNIATVGANHLLVAYRGCYAGCQGGGNGGFSDSFGLTWNFLSLCSVNLSGPSNSSEQLIWALTGANSGSDTFTLSGSNSGVGGTTLFVSEYSGVNNTSPLEGEHCGTGLAGGTVTSGNFTTTASGDLIVGGFEGGASGSAGGTFTSRASQFSSTRIIEDKIAGAPGTYDANFGTVTKWIANGAAFFPLGAGPQKIRHRAQVIRKRYKPKPKKILRTKYEVKGDRNPGAT